MPTQLINELKGRIDEHLVNNSLTLNPEVIGIPNIDSIFEAIFNASDIAISNAVVTVADETLTVTGEASFLSTAQIPLTVEFKDINGVYQTTVLPQATQTLSDVSAMLFGGAFPVPQLLEAFRLAGIEIPTAGEAVTVRTQLSESLDLGGGQLVLQAPMNLTIEATNILQPSPSLLARLAATVTLVGKSLQLSGEFAPGEEEGATFQIEPGLDSLNGLLEALIGTGITFFENLAISDLQVGKLFVEDEFELSGQIGDTWSIPLGLTGLEVSETWISLKRAAGDISGTLQGKVSLAGAAVEIQSDLAGDLTLGGQLPEVKLRSLIDELAGSLLSLPAGFPDLSLPPADFQIQPVADSVRFLLQAPVNNFGMANLFVTEIDSEWAAAILFILPEDWKFSDLSNLLSPLNVLPITAPRLALASFNAPSITLPVIDGEALQMAIQEGLSLSSNLRLQGLGLDFIGQIIGIEQLPLQLAAGDNLANSRVRASFDQTIEVLPSVVVLSDMGIDITPEPFVLEFASRALVSVAGNDLPEFQVSTGITENSTRLIFQTAEIWREPFDISNLTINQLVFQMESGPPPKYAVLGDIAVAGKTIKAAVELVGNFPSMIFGQLDGKLSLAEVIDELVGLSLPDVLDVSIEDFMLRAVGDPMGVTIGDEHFEHGLALQGTLGFLGLEMFTKVVVDPDSGVFAHASLSEKVELGNVLTISNAAGDGPPSATLDTRRPPFLQVSGMVNLLGLKDSVEATIDDQGMAFMIEKALGPAQYRLDSTFNSITDFRAEGSFNFGIKESIGPLEITPGISLGKIALDVGFNGKASLSLINEQFRASIEGGFHFQGLNLRIPKIALSAAPDSLERLPQLVIEEIRDKAEEIFIDFLQDADKWLLGIRDGLVEGVKNVATVLEKEFNRSAEQIGKDIRDTLGRGSEAAAQGLKDIGKGAEQIANVLKGLGDSQSTVKSALQKAGFPNTEVSKALQVSFGIPHGDFPAQGHIDTPLLPHLDTPLTPHVDVKQKVHVDTPIIPHGDRRKQGHADVPRKGHIDVPAQGHIDGWISHTDFRRFGAHGDFGVHGDTKLTPHGDTKLTPHVDTPIVPHLDSAKVGHGDVKALAHGDLKALAHADVPAQGHADTPTIPHGDAP